MKKKMLRRTPLAQGVALALGITALSPAFAQDNGNTKDKEKDKAVLQEVVVTGIRASLESSMNLKRDAVGVVDGIVAEDIGKFPDTNLAESLQRISGVSIDRTAGGEGSRVTVRGLGPDFNLVLLNGRQMPTANIEATAASNSRAFDFANLSPDAIAAVKVYKTGRADTPPGGIGATINIITAKPFDRPGLHYSVGAKAVTDTANDHLPSQDKGKKYTPEISGIYSNTFADNTIGVSISGSYQDRAEGYNQAAVSNGWRNFKGDEVNWGTIPLPGAPGSENITNRPGPNDIYSVPQNMNYSVNGLERKRTNGQLTLQYRPVDSVTATLDYTYSELKLHTLRNELSAWFNFGPSVSSWTDGPVAGPVIYSETIACPQYDNSGLPGCADVAMAGSNFSTKNENRSIGFNLKWDATDTLSFALDAHHSTATAGADGPLGSNNSLGTAGFFRGTTTVDFSQPFPVLSIDLPPAMNGNIDPAQMLATGSSFRNSYMKNEIQQLQLTGDWEFGEVSRLDFGVGLTDVKNRSAYAYNQQDNWGGLGTAADYPDSAFYLHAVRPYFSNIPGSSNPNLFNQFFTWDFNAIRNAAIAVWQGPAYNGNASMFQAPTAFTTDRRTKENSKSAYLQYGTEFDIGRPVHLNAGLRYEKTDVTSSALVPTATGNIWGSANEFTITFGQPGFTTLKGSYAYWLPSLDVSVDVTPNVILRASTSKTIARPNWGDIQGGQTLDQLARIDGGTGSQGNPALKPVQSENIDLSLEWYYDKDSYLSVGYFHKDVTNFVGTSVVNGTPFDLPNPGAGPWVTEAINNGCANSDVVCIRNYIFANHANDPAVTVTGTDSNGNTTGTIAGRPGIDPATNFRITVPSNQRSDTIHGWELAAQHVFGDSGIGVGANYTKVQSGLKYDNYNLGTQFALVGLSDSANLVAFYEKHGISARVAYNWRGRFLTALYDAAGPNPVYVAPYKQVDLDLGYNVTENLIVQAQVLNLTNSYQRLFSRNWDNAEYVTQTGSVYMLGARYKF